MSREAETLENTSNATVNHVILSSEVSTLLAVLPAISLKQKSLVPWPEHLCGPDEVYSEWKG